MTKFIWKPISRQMQMGRRRNKSEIKYIVVHWTSNTSPTAGAMAHYNYLQYNSVRPGSAHYYVDDDIIGQFIGDTTVAWSVEGRGYRNGQNGCWNYNSLNIEMCVNHGYSDKMVFNTIELVKNLLVAYPDAIVCRHWDCNKKDCPSGWTGANNSKWDLFLREIKKPRRMLIDLSKSGECSYVSKKTWQKENNKWVYYKNEEKVTGWLEDKGNWYYIDPASKTMITGWLAYKNKDGKVNHFYFTPPSGVMKKGWLQYNKNWFFFNEEGYMHTGWLTYTNKDGGKSKFYFDKDGYMLTGEQIVDGKKYKFDSEGFLVN